MEEFTDFTNDEYVVSSLKEIYKKILFSLIQDSLKGGERGFGFIEDEIEDPDYVTCIAVDGDLDLITEEGMFMSYLQSYPYTEDLKEVTTYCGTDKIVVYNIREWYDTELVPELKVLIEVAKL